jgi:hypothetical protein
MGVRAQMISTMEWEKAEWSEGKGCMGGEKNYE